MWLSFSGTRAHYIVTFSLSENNEPGLCAVLVIGEGADTGSPVESGMVCFNISVGEDMFKEGIELFTLTLDNMQDKQVWLGRDRALLIVQENGGMAKLLSYTNR